jgi:cytochrome c biogenesis protein CcmG/thiol:disulfide interchange protein DsbE
MLTNNWTQKINRWICGFLLFGLVCFLWAGLNKQPLISEAHAQVQKFPNFNLSDIRDDHKNVTLKDVEGKPFVVHIWASWCGTCMREHGFWVDIQKQYQFPLVGVLYRDKVEKINRFLTTRPDPYLHLLSDPSGSMGLDLGILGIPATFVVDAKGKIQYAHFGQMSHRDFENKILPHLKSYTQAKK